MDSYFIGEFEIGQEDSPYKDFGPVDWSLHYIERYGQTDGAHHKAWVLDQIARIIHGTKVILTEARWTDGTKEYRVELDKPSEKYLAWVISMLGNIDEDGESEYDYEEGVPP